MGIEQIRALKNKEGKGTILTADQARNLFKGKVSSNPMAGKFASGNYECSKGSVYFRSKWEANYALYLDWLIKQGHVIGWEFEPEVFLFEKIKSGTRTYKPDFRVETKEGMAYHEVKGYMDPKSNTKLKRMAKYFPKVKMILVDAKSYREIIKRMKGIIKFYT